MIYKLKKQLKPLCGVKRVYAFFIAFAVTAVMISGNNEKSMQGGAAVTAYLPAVMEEPATYEAAFIEAEYDFDYDYLDIDGSDTLYAAAKPAKARELTAVTADIKKVEANKDTDKKSEDAGQSDTHAKKSDKDTQESVTDDDKAWNEKKIQDESESGFVYSEDIPMSRELQKFTYDKCVERGLEYELVLAIMWRESRFTLDAVNMNTNGTRDNGLMQINDVNKKWLKEKHGIVDLLDPYQNINAGTAMLEELTAKYGAHNAMLAYQYGEGGMSRRLKQGQTTSKATELAYAQRDYYRQIL